MKSDTYCWHLKVYWSSKISHECGPRPWGPGIFIWFDAEGRPPQSLGTRCCYWWPFKPDSRWEKHTPGTCNDGGKSLPTFKRTFRTLEVGSFGDNSNETRDSCFLETDCWTGVKSYFWMLLVTFNWQYLIIVWRETPFSTSPNLQDERRLL